ncbi:MAG TPA: tripartite tricarboxylate transporter substrate binding protein [Advenella sp.]|nr:tripartite tricarboxylate transporter substrate binding protein [Advenella sp.]
MKTRILIAVLFSMLALGTSAVHAAYPEKSVRLIVGYAPGGSTDIVARLLANALTEKWGQPVVVENKGGASGMIATEQVVRAAPDGYTLQLAYTPEVSINKLVFKDIRYDPVADLTALNLVASAPLVLAAGPSRGIKSIEELLALQGKSSQLTYGSPGVGGQQHMAGEVLRKLTGLSLVHVPYRGTALAVTDLVGGQIDLFFATTPPLLGNIQAGKIRPLLVAGDKREALLPEVPTAVEKGMPQLQLTNWFGLFGPKGLPAAVKNKINEDVMTILADSAFQNSLKEKGLTPTPLSPDAFAKFIASEMVKYEAIVRDTGIEQQ